MNVQHIKIMSIFIVTALAVVLSAIGYSTANAISSAYGDDPVLEITNLGDTKQWVKVNQRPYRISSEVDALCRLPTRDDYAYAQRQNPHAAAYVNVYVNKIGARVMSSQEQSFPIGTIIVKEKFYSDRIELKEKSKPTLFTVMIKRESGYNPESGDWEYAVVSGDGKKIQ